MSSDKSQKEVFASLYARLSASNRALVHEYANALKAGDTDKVERMERDVLSRRKVVPNEEK